MYERVILKLSGEGLNGNSNEHFDTTTVNRIVDEVGGLIKNKVQVAIVVGGGNFWRGRDASPEIDKTKAHQIGMLATIMNGLYLSEAFRNSGFTSVVMTPYEVSNFAERFTKEKALKYMAKENVVILAGGTGLPFFSTDSIVAVRALELEVDVVLYAKNISSVYTADPKKAPDAKRYKTVPYSVVLENSLQVADISAIDLTRSANIPSLVFGLSKAGSITAACKGDKQLFEYMGTKISNDVKEEYYV